MRIDVRFMEILRVGSWGKGETLLKNVEDGRFRCMYFGLCHRVCIISNHVVRDQEHLVDSEVLLLRDLTYSEFTLREVRRCVFSCIFPILKGRRNNEFSPSRCHFFHSTVKQFQLQMLAGSLATSTNTSASSSFPCAWLCGGEPVPFLAGNGCWKSEGRWCWQDSTCLCLTKLELHRACTTMFCSLWKLQFDSNDQNI